MNPLRDAFSYFTILPLRAGHAPGAEAVALLPVVGAAVGALAGAAAWAAGTFAPAPLAIAVGFGCAVLLTGAIHVDGFLDACDALFASVEPARRLEILKDPRHGTFALAGMAVASALWLAAIACCPRSAYIVDFAWAAASARLAAIWNARLVPYAPSRTASAALRELPPLSWLVAETLVLGSCATLFSSWLCAALALSIASSVLCARWAAARLGGGLTGDVYGFLIVCCEPVLLAACGLAR